jgi:hypothetical protein
MATSPASAKQTVGFPKLKTERFIPNLKGKADDDVVRMDVVDMTLTKDTLLDRDLVAGKPLLFILRQDATGGWNVTFQTLPDGSLKFKGMTTVGALDTTANTFTTLLFFATSENEALIVNITGGNLN